MTKEILEESILVLAAREFGVRPKDLATHTKHKVACAFKRLARANRVVSITLPGGNNTTYFLTRKAANSYFAKFVAGEVTIPQTFGGGLYIKATKTEDFQQHEYAVLATKDVAGSGYQVRL